MMQLSQNELLAANKIINAGLLKAADSLSFFMKEKIDFVAHDDQQISEHEVLKLSKNKKGTLRLLTTEVLGEMKGFCCLIFSEEETEILCSLTLSPEIAAQPHLKSEMEDAILLEIDNIISASVITQFANILKKNIYGAVPSLRKLQFPELANYVGQEIEKDLYVIRFETRFISGRINFCPEFLWLLDSRFVEIVRKFASQDENIRALEHKNL